ncbi:hypothetical protein HDG34_002504 [Paraburkholderia sp. HC6.4b]|uniref:hypothetical protein n=1 Tax=unclassified Paraburkholderia TaxID=2615204 RepID=UPI00160B27B5|nr:MULTISPECIES: hypothetical protein [unclassified Paraburkholderia]MBB5408567.1 hypothetical protein [Paraburkholderia sp. HC6.4b]MBB5450399.1 hypothetical protein [Paraburkholderia sp. Kb1A]
MKLTTQMLEGLTEQDVFDIAAWHLLDQGERAITMTAKGISGISGICHLCSYRAPDGRRCPVGWLIPDEEYRECFEGKRAAILPMFARDAGCSPTFVAFLEGHERLLTHLQYIHDNHAAFMWWTLLRELAHKRDLDDSVIDHMKAQLRERAERDQAEAARHAPDEVPFLAFDPSVMPACQAAGSISLATIAIMQVITDAITNAIALPAPLLTDGSPGHVITQPEETREAAPA